MNDRPRNRQADNAKSGALRHPNPRAPALQHLDFAQRRSAQSLQSELASSLIEPASQRLCEDVRSTQRQIEVEHARLRSERFRLDVDPPPEQLQVLLEIAHQLLDLLESRLTRLADGRQWGRTWLELSSRLLAQDAMSIALVHPLVAASRTLADDGIREVWLSLAELVHADVQSQSSAPEPTARFIAQTAVEALAGALLTSMQAVRIAGRIDRWNDAIAAAALRDVGWLSMQSYLRAGLASERVLWIYTQHPLVSRALLGSIADAPVPLREMIALHHERCDGYGLTRQPRDRQTHYSRMVAAVSRLVDLTRLVPEDLVLSTLQEEAAIGWWDRELVESLAWPTVNSPHASALRGWVPQRVAATERPESDAIRELHGEHAELQGTHTIKPHTVNLQSGSAHRHRQRN